MKKNITFVTGNPHKLREVQQILGASAATFTNSSLDLEEIQGTAAEVSTAKALKAAELIDGPVLVEDTALEFDALNGLPGPYIKWFFESLGNDGLYNLLAGHSNKKGRKVCTFGFCEGPGAKVELFQAVTQGTIVKARYSKDPSRVPFGWTPIFEPEGWDMTFAEMPEEVKNSFSARYVALGKVKAFLEKRDSSRE